MDQTTTITKDAALAECDRIISDCHAMFNEYAWDDQVMGAVRRELLMVSYNLERARLVIEGMSGEMLPTDQVVDLVRRAANREAPAQVVN